MSFDRGRGLASRSLSAGYAWFQSAPQAVPAILLLALLLRVAVIAAFPIQPHGDSLWYLHRATEMARGLGFQEAGLPTAFWPVGYPALLGAAIALLGPSMLAPLLLNLVAAIATIMLIIWFARRLGGGEATARIAALLYAIYPAHVVYAGDSAAEVTSTAVVMAGMALLVKGHGRFGLTLLAGIILGLATLMRPQFLLLAPVMLVPMSMTMRDFNARRAIKALVVTGLGMALVVLPWTARNLAMLHAPVMVSTNGGIALQAGANSLTDGGYFQVEKSPLWAEVGIPFADRVRHQVEIDARLKAMAKRWIAEHPTQWFLLGFKKTFLLWARDTDAFWALDENHPHMGTAWKAAQAINQLYYMLVMAGAVLGFAWAARETWRRGTPSTLLILAAMPVFCSALAFGFSGQTRYHFPAMPFLIIATASVAARSLSRRGADQPRATESSMRHATTSDAGTLHATS